MSTFLENIHIVRYLMVWKVNSSVVRLPDFFPADISRTLGAIIAKRLPTKEKKLWLKSLSLWDDYDLSTDRKKNKRQERKRVAYPDIYWPIESVIFVYPGKMTYGRDEFIVWELKLLGRDAGHGMFLEVILPAMEEAGFTTDKPWFGPNKLWGHFDIHSVYVAKGNQWQPLVKDGQLNLRTQVTPTQWADDLDFSPPKKMMRHFSWPTPFEFDTASGKRSSNPKKPVQFSSIMKALNKRFDVFAPQRHSFWDAIGDEDKALFNQARAVADEVKVTNKNIRLLPKN